jgi:hypothetical protein
MMDISNKNETMFLDNMISTLLSKAELAYGFRGNCPGQTVHNTCGIISRFHTNSDFDLCSAFPGQHFTKTSTAVSSLRATSPLTKESMRDLSLS